MMSLSSGFMAHYKVMGCLAALGARDTLNSRLSIYVPKNSLVKKDVIYLNNCSRARLNLPGEAGPFASYI